MITQPHKPNFYDAEAQGAYEAIGKKAILGSHDPSGDAAGAFEPTAPDGDDLTVFNFTGDPTDRAITDAEAAPRAASSAIDTDGEVVVPLTDNAGADVVPITRAKGYVRSGDVDTDKPDLRVAESPKTVDRLPRNGRISKEKLLGYGAAVVLAVSGAAAITDGFKRLPFGSSPTPQQVKDYKKSLQQQRSNIPPRAEKYRFDATP